MKNKEGITQRGLTKTQITDISKRREQVSGYDYSSHNVVVFSFVIVHGYWMKTHCVVLCPSMSTTTIDSRHKQTHIHMHTR